MTKQAVVQEDPHASGRGYTDSMDEILALIKGRVPVIWVITHEETRFIQDFKARIADPHNRQLWIWSGVQGLVPFEDQTTINPATGDQKNTQVVDMALENIAKMAKAKGNQKGIVYIMRDMHDVLQPMTIRRMRDYFDHLIGHGKTIVIVSSGLGQAGGRPGIPASMEKQISVVEYELPNDEVVKGRISDILEQMKHSVKNQDKKIELDYTEEQMTEFSRALSGLTLFEVDNSISTSMTHLKKLRVEKLINDKKQIVSRDDILEFVDENVKVEDVGGLDLLKTYLNRYRNNHTEEAKEFGAEPLKGIILAGVPGTGKSLTAKVMGKMWKLPLIRLDIGKVMGSLVGQSEAKMREAIKQIEAMAPCVLWIDEIEKGLSGTKSSNFSDGGTLARVFGTLLHAMQDRMAGVTIFATANDITKLPSELIRRFNNVFFVDLPGPDERWDIFAIHLKKRGRDPKKFLKAKEELLEGSVDFTGAEIEKAILDALAEAFSSGSKDITKANLLEALKETKPIAKVMKKQIKGIREAANGQYKYASSWAESQGSKRSVRTSSGKKLDLDLDDLPEIKSGKKKNKEELQGRESRFGAAVAEAEE